MARRSKPSRRSPTPVQPAALPTPIPSAITTPLSSAYPSTYPSEDELDDDDLDKPNEEAKPDEAPPKGFNFLGLPAELRLRVYGYHFAPCPEVVDLEPDNYKRVYKQLILLRACKQVYHEAGAFFYGGRTFRVFPIHPGRFFKTKKPLLARLTSNQRAWITSLELRLGPGFNSPPRGWVVNDALGLRHCASARKLRVYVEIDPSDSALKGFRRSEGFYEDFSRRLMTEILGSVPSIETVEFDAWSSVKISGAMMQGLLGAITPAHQLAWGPDRGWNGASAKAVAAESEAAILAFEKLTLIDYIPA